MMASANPDDDRISGVMSLKTIPGFGKSGTSEMSEAIWTPVTTATSFAGCEVCAAAGVAGDPDHRGRAPTAPQPARRPARQAGLTPPREPGSQRGCHPPRRSMPDAGTPLPTSVLHVPGG